MPKNIFDKFIELIKLLDEHDIEYVLIGGFAIILHGYARATQDVDLFLNPTEQNVNKFRMILKKLFNDNSVDQITLDELKKYPVIRYGTDDGFCIDIIVGIGTAFSYADLEYEIKQVEGCKIKVATIDTLYKMKENTYREIDKLDIMFLQSKKKNANKKI